MSDEMDPRATDSERHSLPPGAALSTLTFEYDEIPLERLGDDDDEG